MIRKSGFAVLSAVTYSVLEAILFGYSYFIIFTLILFFVMASDIIIFNKSAGRDLFSIQVERRMQDPNGRKYLKKEIELFFTNPTRKVIAFHYYDTLSDVFRIDGDYDGNISLAPGERRRVTYQIASVAIGKYQIGPVILFAQDPMKLCITRAIVEKINEVKIGPSSADIHTQRSERLSNFLFTMGIHHSKKSGQGYDFYGIRQYVDSDDFRYVAWNRYDYLGMDDLYIKQMEEEKQIDTYFIIDYGDGVNQGTPEGKMYDRIVSTVLNAAYTIIKNRDGVGFQIVSSEIDEFIPAQKSEEPIKKLEKIVSEIKPSGEFRMDYAAELIRKRVKKNAVVFIITPYVFPEEFTIVPGKTFNTGRSTYLFVLDPYDFVKKSDDMVQNKLLQSVRMKERRYMTAVTKFFNGFLGKAVVARDKDLLVRVMAEYRYARMLNLGS
ncbi:MAG: DUF58 domain-containing protein [Candidatus Thermoplasmatota archaeon]|nr:DUF58 domain-containing protein [Candidatus Thermoplasmatota archaeon]